MTAETYQSTTTRLTRQELGACTLIEDLLPLYIEGEVSPSSRDLIVEHLARCERCAGFLAGAQSVRAQLRRDIAQHTSVITDKLPERRAVGLFHTLATLISVLFCCAMGEAGSMMAWHGVTHGSVVQFLVGLFGIGTAFCGLVALAYSYGRLTLGRMLILTACCALGGMAALPIMSEGGGATKLLALWLGLIGIAGIWIGVRSGEARSR